VALAVQQEDTRVTQFFSPQRVLAARAYQESKEEEEEEEEDKRQRALQKEEAACKR
jgi:hypothetical protein